MPVKLCFLVLATLSYLLTVEGRTERTLRLNLPEGYLA